MNDKHTRHFRIAGLDCAEEVAVLKRELGPLVTSKETSQPIDSGRVMSGTVLRPTRKPLAHRVCLEPALQRMRPLLSVLLIEYRDEVFARLEYDLRQLGYQVCRAQCAEDVLRIHINSTIDLTISSSELPTSSLWLMAAKLRMYDTNTRIWLYAASRSIRDRDWATLLGIEKIIHYDGDLFKLTERIGLLLSQPGIHSGAEQSFLLGFALFLVISGSFG